MFPRLSLAVVLIIITVVIFGCDRKPAASGQMRDDKLAELIASMECRKVQLADKRHPWLRTTWWGLGASAREVGDIEQRLSNLAKECVIDPAASLGAGRRAVANQAAAVLTRGMQSAGIGADEMRQLYDIGFVRALAHLKDVCSVVDEAAFELASDGFAMDEAAFERSLGRMALGNCAGQDPDSSGFGGLGTDFDEHGQRYRSQLHQCIRDVAANARKAPWEECRGLESEDSEESNVDAVGNEHIVQVEERSNSTTLNYVVCDGACAYDEDGNVTNPLTTSTSIIRKHDDGTEYLVTITDPTETEPGEIRGRPLSYSADPVEAGATDDDKIGKSRRDFETEAEYERYLFRNRDNEDLRDPDCLRMNVAAGLDSSILISSNAAVRPGFPEKFGDKSPFLTVDAILMCECNAKASVLGSLVPSAMLGLACGTEADTARLDCLRNPAGPDDAPGKCSQYVIEDLRAHGEANDQCSLIHCAPDQEPTVLSLLGDQFCGCFSPQAVQGIFQGQSANECSTLNCGDGICACEDGACGCRSLTGIWTIPDLPGFGGGEPDH